MWEQELWFLLDLRQAVPSPDAPAAIKGPSCKQQLPGRVVPDINPTQEAQRPATQGMGASTLSPALRMLFFLSPKLSKSVSRRQGFSNNDAVFHKSNRCLLKCFHLVKKKKKLDP